MESVDPNLLKTIQEYHGQGPRDKHPYPETENQWLVILLSSMQFEIVGESK